MQNVGVCSYSYSGYFLFFYSFISTIFYRIFLICPNTPCTYIPLFTPIFSNCSLLNTYFSFNTIVSFTLLSLISYISSPQPSNKQFTLSLGNIICIVLLDSLTMQKLCLSWGDTFFMYKGIYEGYNVAQSKRYFYLLLLLLTLSLCNYSLFLVLLLLLLPSPYCPVPILILHPNKYLN